MKFDIPEEEYLHHAQFIIDEKLNQCRGLINDGSHSFNELYYHRMILLLVSKRQKDNILIIIILIIGTFLMLRSLNVLQNGMVINLKM